MCYNVFIATAKPQMTNEFIPGVTSLYLQLPTCEQLEGLQNKFSLPKLYYVGSDTLCSCGFDFSSKDFHNPEWENNKASPQALIDFITEQTLTHEIQYYCCWEGDWDTEPEETLTLNIKEVSLDRNYFGLVEGQFINFECTNQNT